MYTPKRRQNPGGVGRGISDESSFFMHNTNSPYKTLNLSVGKSEDKESRKTFTKDSTYQVIEQGESHQLLSYGNMLPVEVAKVLSNDGTISCKILASGWAVVVGGRKLYAWRYTASSVKKMVSCFELQLSSTELTHSAELTCILQTESHDVTPSLNFKTSLMNVSAEGNVRYWLNVTRPSMLIESNIDLSGKQCQKLLPLMPYGCILLTTTNEMYLLTPTMTSIACHQLTSANGMLSNIGRRVSNFWAQPVKDQKYLSCMCEGTLDFDQAERYFYVAMKGSLQKWMARGVQISDTKMLFEIPLLKHLKSKQDLCFTWDGVDDIQVLDIKNTGYGVVLLLAVWKDDGSYFCCLATIKVHSADDVNFVNVSTVEHDLLNVDPNDFKLVLPLGGYMAYLTSSSLILAQSVMETNKRLVAVEFNMENNSVIGGGSNGNEAIFLSKRHGLVTLKLSQSQVSLPNDVIPKHDRKIQMDTAEKVLELSSDSSIEIILRSAFLRCTKNEEITDLSVHISNDATELGSAVQAISTEILNSLPATDNRWASSHTKPSLQSTSVLLLNQLNDKVQIFETYLKFLELSNSFHEVESVKDQIHCCLCEHGEKLQSCITLLNLYADHENLINKIINNDEDMPNTTNSNDKCFSKVTDIDQFFMLLIRHENDCLKEINTVKEKVELIASTSSIITNCFTSAWQYRQNYQSKYQVSQNVQVPWTGSSIGVNNRGLLKTQVNLLLQQALPNVDSVKNGSLLSQYVMLLADLLLDAFERELNLTGHAFDQYTLESLSEDFSYQREHICTSLAHQNYFEQALTLAEKYEDFAMLIFLCEQSKNEERLNEYKVSFQTQGFTDVLYKYYMDKGAWGRLMSLENSSSDYEKFLTNHNQLSWLHFIGSKEFSKASHVLKGLADEEKVNVEKKKMMYILSNLSMLASDEDRNIVENNMRKSDKELELIEYQNNIAKFLLRDDLSPMNAADLLKKCLDDDSNIMDEKYYIMLLELLAFVEHDAEDFGQAIWNKIILKDSWDEQSTLHYSVILSLKLVYKCLKYFIDRDSISELLPSLNKVLTSADNSLTKTCKTQLKACYELLSVTDDMIVT